MVLNPNEIMPLITKFQESRVFLTAVELDVFTLLANTPKSGLEIANKMNVN